jgi:hypothetical protein
MGDPWLLQSSDHGHRVVRLDRGSGAEVAAVELRDPPPMIHDSAQLVFGAGALWVAAGHALLYRIDPVAHRQTHVLDIGNHLDGVAADDHGVWLTTGRDGGRLVRVDGHDQRIDVAVPHRGRALALGGGAVWTTWTSAVSRVDPASLAVTHTIALDGFIMDLGFADDALWAVTAVPGAAPRATVWRVAADTMQASVALALPGRVAMVASGGALWLGQQEADGPDRVIRVELATGAQTAWAAAFAPVFVDAHVWGVALDGAGGQLARLDPATGVITRVGAARGHTFAVAPGR